MLKQGLASRKKQGFPEFSSSCEVEYPLKLKLRSNRLLHETSSVSSEGRGRYDSRSGKMSQHSLPVMSSVMHDPQTIVSGGKSKCSSIWRKPCTWPLRRRFR